MPFWEEGNPLSLFRRESLWKVHPMSCQCRQLLRGFHAGIIPEKEGESSSLCENLVFPLPSLHCPHPSPLPPSLFSHLPPRVLESYSFGARNVFGLGHLLSSQYIIGGETKTQGPRVPLLLPAQEGGPEETCKSTRKQAERMTCFSPSADSWPSRKGHDRQCCSCI